MKYVYTVVYGFAEAQGEQYGDKKIKTLLLDAQNDEDAENQFARWCEMQDERHELREFHSCEEHEFIDLAKQAV